MFGAYLAFSNLIVVGPIYAVWASFIAIFLYALIGGWKKIRNSQRLVASLFLICFVSPLNLMTFEDTSLSALHGFASEGRVDHGHYFVGYRGQYYEVSQSAYLFNLRYGQILHHAVWISILSFIIGFALLRHAEVAAKRKTLGLLPEGRFLRSIRYTAAAAVAGAVVIGFVSGPIIFLGIIAMGLHHRGQGAVLFVVGGTMLLASILGPRLTRRLWRRYEALKQDRAICGNCGYSRAGNPSDVCPECGRRVSEDHPQLVGH